MVIRVTATMMSVIGGGGGGGGGVGCQHRAAKYSRAVAFARVRENGRAFRKTHMLCNFTASCIRKPTMRRSVCPKPGT